MWSRARQILSIQFLCACSLLILPSCGGSSAIQRDVRTSQASPLKIITTKPADGAVGQNYSFQLQTTGGGPPLNWSLVLGNLPPGVSLNANTGTMAGIPAQGGSYSFTVEVTDSSFSGRQASMRSLKMAVSASALAIATPALPDGTVGQPYNVQLQASGGILPYTWSILQGSLAPGVQLDPLTGEITGTPTQAGTSQVIIEVMDSSFPQSMARLILGGPESRLPVVDSD